jgi:two-component system, OmpR family, phosphate regulon sensor histidine kinase PhoR
MLHSIHWRITIPVLILVIIVLVLANLNWLNLPVSVGIVVATLIIIPLSVKKAIQPVKDLTHAAWEISSIRPNRAGSRDDELEEFSLSFNAMARQLRTQIEELMVERKTLNAVLQYMTDGVIIADELGVIKLFNQAAEQIYGVKAEHAVGRSLAETLRYYQVVELWQHHRKTGEEEIAFLELGQPRQFIQSVALSLEDALPGCTLLIFQDMTQLRHLETVRRDFISNISHELRTPLASLKALTETLRDGALKDKKAAKRFLAQIETEVDALSHMVSELLELSRIESGKFPLNLKPVKPIELLTPAFERLSLQAERAGVAVQLVCPEDLPPVMADSTRIEQTVVNLLHNAIKFTPAPGQIVLSAVEEGKHVIFSVADTGIGISKDDLPRIFERFYKIDPARRSSGTGLGLAIARHLVEAHGGRIWAESQEGNGSTFNFSLPVA